MNESFYSFNILLYNMAARDRSIDVVIDTQEEFVPECEHGPTLMFSRFDTRTKTERRFFACSAFRDKKVCSFFKWVEDVKQNKRKQLMCNDSFPNAIYNHKAMRERFAKVKNLSCNERSLCVDCGLFLLPDEGNQHKEEKHTLRYNITDEMLSKPTELFIPFDDNKTYAQYLFTKKTVNFLLDLLVSMDITSVLCIGCPRIHEAIQNRMKEGKFSMKSLLLDLDHRYLQVFPPEQLCRYNMLNNHFFGGDIDKNTFKKFLHVNGKVAIVTDPPFGVMVDALYKTLNIVQEEWRTARGIEDTTEMPVFWFFPYFMEKRVNMSCPSYSMLDYKVDYDNHDLFRGDKGRKKGSPVRIFTNLSPKLIPLPQDDGYWYCDKCERYSAQENKHCSKCECCPTKDGSTYKHCDVCKRCVKPNRIHCSQCNICDLPEHTCGQSIKQGCHICGALDHKRRECPNKNKSTESSVIRTQKRKGCEQFSSKKKKRK
ncbi:rRNA N6-adenosine-methyltransferase zcchc4 [Mactra antiquata]